MAKGANMKFHIPNRMPSLLLNFAATCKAQHRVAYIRSLRPTRTPHIQQLTGIAISQRQQNIKRQCIPSTSKIIFNRRGGGRAAVGWGRLRRPPRPPFLFESMSGSNVDVRRTLPHIFSMRKGLMNRISRMPTRGIPTHVKAPLPH